MKTILTTSLALALASGVLTLPAAASPLEPGRLLIATNHLSDTYDALSGQAGFSPAVKRNREWLPGFTPPQEDLPVMPQAGAGLAPPALEPPPALGTPGQDTAMGTPWQTTTPHQSGKTGKGAQSPTPGGGPPALPVTTTGDTANNSVLYRAIPSGQYSFGFGSGSGGRAGRRLPPTSTSSVDFDIVDR
ncbi:MAG TPA: hypothetical protein V6D08_03145 [Candidatus Obscuribacterales bacterium]